MADAIRILYVDDEPDLLWIGKLFLEESGEFSVTTIASASAALELLNKEKFDAIVSDYQMPVMDGIQFLVEVRTSFGKVPFILFTGKSREEVVIQAINSGADFYLQKGGDPKAQFAELKLKIRQAVQRHKAETDLVKSEANLQAIIANTNDIIASYDPEVRLLVYNQAASETYRNIFGIELYPGLCTLDLFPESMRGFWNTNNERALAGESFSIEFNLQMLSDQEWFFESSYNPIRKDGVVIGFSTFTRDITERKRAETELSASYEQIAAAEEELRGQFDTLVKNEKDLRESEERYRLISENTADVIWILNYKTGKFTYVSPSVQKLRGYTSEEVMTQTMPEALTPKSMETINGLIQEGIAKRKPGDTNRYITTNLIDQPCKDGSVVSTEVVSTLVFDELGDPIEIIGISRDITERKVAEKAILHQSATLSILNEIISTANKADDLPQLLNSILEESLRLLNFNAGGIYLVDRSTRMANVVHCKNLPPEFLAEIQTIIIDKKPYDTLFIKNEPIITENYAQIAPDRSKKFGFQSMVSIPLLSKGMAIGALNLASMGRHIIFDEEKQTLIAISRELGSTIERMSAEEKVKEAAKNLETLFNSIEEMVFVLDMQGVILAVNETVQKRLSYTSEELTGTDVLLLHVPERRDEALRIVQGMIAGTIDSCPVPVLAKDGTRIEVETKVTRGWWNGSEVLIGVTRDITERKRAELELESTLERLKEAHRLAHIGTFNWVIKTDTVTWSEELFNIAGMDPSLSVPSFAEQSNLYSHSSWNLLNQAVSRTLSTEEPFNIELEFVRPDGSVRHTNTYGGLKQDSNGTVIGFYGTVQDITERKQAEEALRTVSGRLFSVLESTGDVIAMMDNEYRYILFNTAFHEEFKKIFGSDLKKGDLMHQALADLPEDLANATEYWDRALGGEEFTITQQFGDATRERNWYDLRFSPIRDSENKVVGAMHIVRNITERKQTEEALSQANKKLNLLSGITRHDIKNKVITIQGFLRFAQKIKDIDEIQPFLDKIQDSAKAIEHQIDFTKDYQDLGVKSPRWLNLSTMIIFARNPAIHITDETGNLQIFADPLFEKVMYNLTDNTIRHGEIATDVHISVLTESENVLIIWADNGVGVPADKKEMIFHRCYGKNTGFGLFLIREILAITGMTIQETGELGKGARFEITVPNGKWRYGS